MCADEWGVCKDGVGVASAQTGGARGHTMGPVVQGGAHCKGEVGVASVA